MTSTLAMPSAWYSPPAAGPSSVIHSAADLRVAVRRLRTGNPSIDRTHLQHVLRVDAGHGRVEVQACTPWLRVAENLATVAPELQHALGRGLLSGTVGDGVATNAPAPDGVPFVKYVTGIAMVTMDGELHRITRKSHAELFALAVGGHDLLGLTYSITFDLEALRRAASSAPEVEVLQHPRTGIRGPATAVLLLPPARAERAIGLLRDVADEWRAPIVRAEARLTAPEDETVLRWATRDFVHLSLWCQTGAVLGHRVRMAQLHRHMLDIALEHDGTYPISTVRDATRIQAVACYPQLARFMAEKRRFDPGERLQNAWYRHHRRLLFS